MSTGSRPVESSPRSGYLLSRFVRLSSAEFLGVLLSPDRQSEFSGYPDG